MHYGPGLPDLITYHRRPYGLFCTGGCFRDWLAVHPELQPAFRSPIEQKFWEACCLAEPDWLADLVPQHPAGPYRIDFALPGDLIGIELDGFRNHSRTADIARDRFRQRWLEGLGWYIIRFGGSEVYHYAAECARQADYLIGQRRQQ